MKKNASSFDIKRRNVLLRMTRRFGHGKYTDHKQLGNWVYYSLILHFRIA